MSGNESTSGDYTGSKIGSGGGGTPNFNPNPQDVKDFLASSAAAPFGDEASFVLQSSPDAQYGNAPKIRDAFNRYMGQTNKQNKDYLDYVTAARDNPGRGGTLLSAGSPQSILAPANWASK